MGKTAVFFGSTGGMTQSVARKIAFKLEVGDAVFNVAETSASEVEDFDNLILGTSTWGFGDLQDDWEDFLPDLARKDLKGKTIALFGLGDGMSYPDSFVDGMGTIYESLMDKGCTMVGAMDTDGYNFDESKAVVGGKFVGLPIDEENEFELTAERIENWTRALTPFLR